MKNLVRTLSLILVTFPLIAFSQSKDTTKNNKQEVGNVQSLGQKIKGTTYQGIVVDSVTKEPIQSAVVYLMGITRGEQFITRSVVTDKKGKFKIEVSGPSKLEVSCMGYKIYTQRVHDKGSMIRYATNKYGVFEESLITSKTDLGVIRLAPDPYNVDEVVVRARKDMFEQHGDTTRIFPRLAKTMEGDALIEVIKMIPGFKVGKDGSIYEDGKLIERTYVNNQLLFGSDPRTAFLKLSATSALAIDTYDEEVDEAEKHLTKRQRRRVANIKTAEELKRYSILDLFAEGGIDHDKDIDGERHKRFGLKGSWAQYQVGRKLEFAAKTNNMVINQDPFMGLNFKSGNPKETEASFAFEKSYSDSVYSNYSKQKVYSPHTQSVNGSYVFSDKRNNTESVSKSQYFPTSYFNTQLIDQKNSNETMNQSHKLKLNYNNRKGAYSGRPTYQIDLLTYYAKSENFALQSNTTTTDGVAASSINNESDNKSDIFDIEVSTNIQKKIFQKQLNKLLREYRKKPDNKWMGFNSNLSILAKVIYKENNGNNLRKYEMSDVAGTNLTNLTIDGEAPYLGGYFSVVPSISCNGKSDFAKGLYSNRDIRLWFEGIYTRSKSYKLAFNQATGEIDNAYSGEVIENNKSFVVRSMINRSWLSGYSFDATIDYELVKVENDERMPNDIFTSKTFNKFEYSVGIRKGYFDLTLNSTNDLPTVNQLSTILNSDDPMNLRAGNPNLKSSRLHSASLRFNNRTRAKKRKINVLGSISGSITTDPIIMTRRYFSGSTILSDYEDYVAAAGSRLYIPENVDKHYSMNGTLTLSYFNQPSNTTVNFKVEGTWSNPLTSLDGLLLRNKNTNANVMLGITSTPTSKVRINIENNTSFAWQKNDKFNDRSRNNFLQASVRYDFLNRMTMTTTYKNDFQKSYTMGTTIDRNSLDISMGARIFRKRNGTLSVNVYNLFNDNSGYSLNINDQYISERWEQLFSRYYSISFQYKFNSIDHKKGR